LQNYITSQEYVFLFKIVFFKHNHHFTFEKNFNLQHKNKSLQPSRIKTRTKNFEHLRTKTKVVNLQEQNRSLQPSRTRIRTFNLQEQEQE
jgi:hypothetical protein